MCAAMKDQLSRQMFEVVIQAAANGKIIARETMKVHHLSTHCNLKAQPLNVQRCIQHTTHPSRQLSVLSGFRGFLLPQPLYRTVVLLAGLQEECAGQVLWRRCLKVSVAPAHGTHACDTFLAGASQQPRPLQGRLVPAVRPRV